MQKDTPDLIKAVWENNLPEVTSLLEKGGEANVRDKSGTTSLHNAVINKNLEICNMLVHYGADVNAADQALLTPLHFAAQEYALDIAAFLIQNGAVLDAQNKFGNTPLWVAVFQSKGRGEMIQLLLRSGADPYKENNSGISPLKLAQTIANFDIKRFFEE